MNSPCTCHRRRTRGGRRRGLTLVELLLALAGTGIVVAAIATMLSATSYGASSSRDLRDVTVRSKTLGSRINAAVRQSHRVLAAGDSYLVLWLEDRDGDGAPSLHEVMRIDRNDDDELTAYTAADDAPDTPWPIDATDFAAVTQAVAGTTAMPGQRWARRVTAWQVTLDADDAHDARLVSHRLILAAGDLSETAVHAASLRNR